MTTDAKEIFQAEANDYNETRRTFWQKLFADSAESWGTYFHQKVSERYVTVVPANSDVLEIGCSDGALLASLQPRIGVGIDFCEEALERGRENHPSLEFYLCDAHDFDLQERKFDYIILSELVNDLWDVQSVFSNLKKFCHPRTRIIINFYSHLWNLPLSAAKSLGIATPSLPQNWLTEHDVRNLLEISGFETIRKWEEVIAPLYIPLVSDFLNRFVAKLFPFRALALTNFIIARSVCEPNVPEPSVSVVIAARNEAGHIEELIDRIPNLGSGTEIIFVEGNSTDNTYEAIQTAIEARPHLNSQLLKQPGKGKGDAVRTGFNAASCDILMILDGDITVPPEDLPRFFELMASGQAEFVNGVRLVYPMEQEAMRFANLLGNKFFSWAFTWMLGQPIRDTLCGTKVLWKEDYERIAAGRKYFGDFDPFGDFDLLFGAVKLDLKMLEVPIRYRARRYGDTNISRWSHGWLLLKMVAFAAKRIKFI